MADDRELLTEALAVEAVAQRALLAGDGAAASAAFTEAAERYRWSWEAAGPPAYGRLVGLLKATVLSGENLEAAGAYVREAVPEPGSPTSWYARGLAAAIEAEPDVMRAAAEGMRAGSPAFGRAADALQALADDDDALFQAAVAAIHADFAARDEHLTGVAIADTALMFERLAARAG